MPHPLHLALLVPGDIDTPTGGYAYARRIVAGLRGSGDHVDLIALGEGFPTPDPAELDAADRHLAAIADHTVVVIDGLALGAMPGVAHRHADRLRLVGLVHHPLALEDDTDPTKVHALQQSESAALAACTRVITTSRTTAALLAGSPYRVPAGRIDVVPPGCDEPPPFAYPDDDGAAGALAVDAARSEAAAESGAVRLLCVASVTPRKGHATLIEALARIAELPWTLRCVGALDRDAKHARAMRALAAARGLSARVHFTGAVDAESLERHYAETDLFVLASRMEGFGMAYVEAVMRGLPVLGTRAGAIPEAVPPAARVLVEPDDIDALADALRSLISDDHARAHLAQGARAARADILRWPRSVALFRAALAHAATNSAPACCDDSS